MQTKTTATKAETHIYTDGAIHYASRVGAWAFVVYQDGKVTHRNSEPMIDTTSNQMELTAMLRAIRWAKENALDATIYSDSQYTVNSCNSWIWKWRKRGWKKSDGTPPENLPLMIQLAAALDIAPRPRIHWVRGHNGTPGNEMADKTARGELAAARMCQRQPYLEVVR